MERDSRIFLPWNYGTTAVVCLVCYSGIRMMNQGATCWPSTLVIVSRSTSLPAKV